MGRVKTVDTKNVVEVYDRFYEMVASQYIEDHELQDLPDEEFNELYHALWNYIEDAVEEVFTWSKVSGDIFNPECEYFRDDEMRKKIEQRYTKFIYKYRRKF